MAIDWLDAEVGRSVIWPDGMHYRPVQSTWWRISNVLPPDNVAIRSDNGYFTMVGADELDWPSREEKIQRRQQRR